MAARNRPEPVAAHTFDTSGLSGSFQVVSAGGFSVDLVIYKIYNNGTTLVEISYDGSTVHDVIPPKGAFIYDVMANKEGSRAAWPAGRELSVRGTAGTGDLYEIGYTLR